MKLRLIRFREYSTKLFNSIVYIKPSSSFNLNSNELAQKLKKAKQISS